MNRLPCSNCMKVVEVPYNALQVWCDDCGESAGARMARREAEAFQKGLQEGLNEKPQEWSGIVNFLDEIIHP